MDDYSFGYASGAGMIADFCAAGGNITKRVFPPLNATDFSSFAQQLPGARQGRRLLLGGRRDRHGPVAEGVRAACTGRSRPTQVIGNLFFFSSGADKELGPRLSGAYVGGFGSSPDLKGAKVTKYKKILDKWFNKYPPLAGKASDHAADGFTYNYYVNAWGLDQGAAEGQGRHLETARRRSRSALRDDGRPGRVRNGQAGQEPPGDPAAVLVPHGRQGRCALDRDGAVHPAASTSRSVARSPRRRAGRTRMRPQEAPVDREGATCRQRRHQVGDGRSGQARSSARSAAPALRLRGVGRRFGGLLAVERRRSRRRSRRAACDPRTQRRRQDDAVQRHLGRPSALVRHRRALRPRRDTHSGA